MIGECCLPKVGSPLYLLIPEGTYRFPTQIFILTNSLEKTSTVFHRSQEEIDWLHHRAVYPTYCSHRLERNKRPGQQGRKHEKFIETNRRFLPETTNYRSWNPHFHAFSTCRLRFFQPVWGLRFHRCFNHSHACLARPTEWYWVIMTREIGNVQLESHHCLVSDQKPSGMIITVSQNTQKPWWAITGVNCVDPVVSEKIKMSWDILAPSAQTQQRHDHVMPHLSYSRVGTPVFNNYVKINCWILNVVTWTMKNKDQKKHVPLLGKHRDSHKTEPKGNHLTRSEPRGFTAKPWESVSEF